MVDQPKWTRHIKSQQLPSAARVVPMFKALGFSESGPRQLHLVVDANVVFNELRYRIRPPKPGAKSALTEAVESGCLRLVAPMELVEHVERAMPRYATARKIPESELRAAWQAYRPEIPLVAVPPPQVAPGLAELAGRDADDVPFVALLNDSGAAGIVTRDKDFESVPDTTVDPRALLHLRDYARHKAIELSLKAAAGGTASLGSAALVAAKNVIVRAPGWLKLAMLAAAGTAILHPTSRRFLKEKGLSLLAAFEALGPLVEEVQDVHDQAKEGADKAWHEVAKRLPPRKPTARVLLRKAAFSACVWTDTPLSLNELEGAIRAAGYRSRAVQLRGPLLRALRRDPRLEATPDGKWQLKRAVVRPKLP